MLSEVSRFHTIKVWCIFKEQLIGSNVDTVTLKPARKNQESDLIRECHQLYSQFLLRQTFAIFSASSAIRSKHY